MTAGRPPVPTKLKILRGNPGKRPLPTNEPQPEPVLPDCPVTLSAGGQMEWARLCDEMGQLGLLTRLDRSAMAVYCEAWAQWTEAQKGINQHGLLIKTPTGYPIQSPLVAVANRAAEMMLRAASEMGLTPSARARLGTVTPNRSGNTDAERFFGT